MDVLVTGGTGHLGQRLVPPAGRGHTVKLMSRRGAGPGGVRGDLATGLDLGNALAGAEIVIHAASDPRGNPGRSTSPAPGGWSQAVDRDRLQHLVYISIVGVDRDPVQLLPGQVRRRAGAARLRPAGHPAPGHAVPHLRRHAARDGPPGPVLPVPMGWRLQPVDVDEVAAHIGVVAAAPPTGGVLEFGGPEELTAADVARAWAAARGSGAHVVATPVPGKMGSAIRDGAALPTGGARGTRTYAQHLHG